MKKGKGKRQKFGIQFKNAIYSKFLKRSTNKFF